MLKYILSVAILIGAFCFPAEAQTPLLQALIDATPAGGTLTLPSDVVYPCNCVIRQAITIESSGAKVVTSNADPAITILPGVHDVTLRGVDVFATGFVYDIVRIGTTGPAQDTLEEVPTNITLDSVQVHGDPLSDSQRGIAANGANVSIVNSRIYEIHFRGQDSQAICVWNGPGPFRFVNNYFEAAGENVMFGGALPSIQNLVPSNIEIRGNYFFKPLSWKIGDPAYAGIHWTVKNWLEFKNARTYVVDNNDFINNWADAQVGYGWLFTVRGEDGQAPWATVSGGRVTNNRVKNTEHAMQLMGADWDSFGVLHASQGGSDLYIGNNSFEGVRSRFAVVQEFQNITYDHNTHFEGGSIFILTGGQSHGFAYLNNVTVRHDYGIVGDGIGEGTVALNVYTPGWIVAGNVIADASALGYPANNFYPADLSNLSSYKGTDGLTPGYFGSVSSPAPTPSPVPSPLPSPSVAPTPAPTIDVTPPTVSISFPAGISVSGTITVNATASDNVGVTETYLLVDNQVVGADSSDPYSFNLDTTRLGDGQHFMYVRAWDAAANAGDSIRVTFTVANASPSPSPTVTPTPLPSPTPSASPTPAPSPSPTPTPKPSPSPSPTPQCVRWNPKKKCLQWR